MLVFKHPKFYAEIRKRAKEQQKKLRERNKSDRVISGAEATAEVERAPGQGLKRQASSAKPIKPQASSSRTLDPGKSFTDL